MASFIFKKFSTPVRAEQQNQSWSYPKLYRQMIWKIYAKMHWETGEIKYKFPKFSNDFFALFLLRKTVILIKKNVK
jgi:hypothetical protein